MEKEIKELQDKLDALILKYEQSKQPFKNGDVVKINSSCGSAIILITDYDNLKGYGFINGVWGTSYAFEFTKWTLATKEEWLEALTKEAVKRGLIEGKKITSLFAGLESEAIGNPYLNSDNQLWIKGKSKNLLIMDNGIWAEEIEEETLDELAKRFMRYWISNNGILCNDFISFFNENKPTINRLSK